MYFLYFNANSLYRHVIKKRNYQVETTRVITGFHAVAAAAADLVKNGILYAINSRVSAPHLTQHATYHFAATSRWRRSPRVPAPSMLSLCFILLVHQVHNHICAWHTSVNFLVRRTPAPRGAKSGLWHIATNLCGGLNEPAENSL